jgi:hypothetical protein
MKTDRLPSKNKEATMPDTIITGGGGDSGAGMIAGIVLAIVLVLGAIWLFNSGALNNAGGGGSNVTIEAPTVEVPAPAPAAPAPANN